MTYRQVKDYYRGLEPAVQQKLLKIRRVINLISSGKLKKNIGIGVLANIIDLDATGVYTRFCADCGIENPEPCILTDDVWLSIYKRDQQACVSCICKRLGRNLTLSDLKVCKFNRVVFNVCGSDEDMKKIKIYRVNDFDWWAGLDRKSVVDAYNLEWPNEYLIETDLTAASELDMKTLIFYDGVATEYTFEEYLNILLAKDTKFPCFFASTEW